MGWGVGCIEGCVVGYVVGCVVGCVVNADCGASWVVVNEGGGEEKAAEAGDTVRLSLRVEWGGCKER